MKKKITNQSTQKAPARVPGVGLVGFGKTIEVDEDLAISLCRVNPKFWKPKGWTLPPVITRRIKNGAGRALWLDGVHVPQDGDFTLLEADAIALIARSPEDWKALGWDPTKTTAETGAKKEAK